MRIKISGYELEEIILDYVKKEIGTKKETKYHEISIEERGKKDTLKKFVMVNDDTEVDVYLEFEQGKRK